MLTKGAYSPRRLADELEHVLSPATIRREIKQGRLKARAVGRTMVVLRADAEEWLDSFKQVRAFAGDASIETTTQGRATGNPMLKRNFYSIDMLADELDGIVTAAVIRNEIKRGKLKARKLGSKILILREDAEHWIAGPASVMLPAPAPPSPSVPYSKMSASQRGAESARRDRMRKMRATQPKD